MSLFYFFAVPPSKPVIRLGDSSGQSVEGYLGPYQIGTRLVLSCQVNGGKNPSKNSRALIANFVQKPDVIMYKCLGSTNFYLCLPFEIGLPSTGLGL